MATRSGLDYFTDHLERTKPYGKYEGNTNISLNFSLTIYI